MAKMTRAMFAQVLANIEGVDLTAYETSRFTDVERVVGMQRLLNGQRIMVLLAVTVMTYLDRRI